MSVRSFTVFQDAPADIISSHCDTDGQPLHSATDVAATLLSTLAAIEKENLHPVTGQRTGPTVVSETKKRKTSALATKVLVAPSSKKHKELKPESKKTRKSLTSTAKSKNSDTRKNSSKPSRSSRKTSPLPPVSEEQELQRQPARLVISQTDINSRCYELTVSPLADVSDAYDMTRTESQESDVHSCREKSVDPVVCDYFPLPIAVNPLQTTNDAPSDTDYSQSSEFSTPERKLIYSAFTFSSPSSTSERFRQAQSSPPRCDSHASSPASNSE